MSDSQDHHMFGSTDHADSAGQPWEGREFQENPFAEDDGTAPAHLKAALHACAVSPTDAVSLSAASSCVVDALRSSRLLIPLLAEAGDVGVGPNGLVVDKTQELAIVSVAGPAGQKVLPVFSSVEAMRRWNLEARPVPVEARRAALAAVADGAQWLVLDPGSSHSVVVRRPAVAALAQDLPWVPCFADSEVEQAFRASCDQVKEVESVSLLPGDLHFQGAESELLVTLHVVSGLNQAQITNLLDSLSKKWATSEIIAQRVDSLRVNILAV